MRGEENQCTLNFGLCLAIIISMFVGESAATERQVSPDKLYRAALLKERFADTILKAREKALNQVGSL